MRPLLICLFIAPCLFAQSGKYNVPKYPPKFGLDTRDVGPRPGSPAPEGSPKSNFQRIYSFPPGLRLLVRTNCGTKIDRRKLIERAKRDSLPKGAPVQIDWEAISGEKAQFIAVISMQKETVSFDLIPKDGKYSAENKQKTQKEDWQIHHLSLGQSRCVNESKMTSKEMRNAVINVLYDATLKHFRGQNQAGQP